MPSESGNDTTQERTFGTVQLWAEKRRIINQAAKGFEADLRGGRVAEVYFPSLYVRSPAAFLDDSIFSPPLLPRMLTNPRTVCGCHPVAFMISGKAAPFARFIIAMTSAFLLVRPAGGLLAIFLARPAFFADLAFLLALRAPLGSGADLPVFSLSLADEANFRGG